MSENNNFEQVRKTIRIPKSLDIRIQVIMGKGEFITESELIRHSINIGLDKIEGGMNDRKNKKD